MSQSQTSNKIIVSPIKAFSDNYIWAITSTSSQHVALVDPGDAQVCINFIEKNNLILSTILITHHHPDHTGGIKELVNYVKNKQQPLAIYAPKNEEIIHATHKLIEDDLVNLPDIGITFNIIDLPGHTLGHIAYYGNDMLFCGDTLFSGGCGRIFEGTPAQMFCSLSKLKNLPERTRLYCTHEYTLANLEFALTVDPTNPELIEYYNQVKQLRVENKITLPSSILREKQINPFLRSHDVNIKQSAIEQSNVTLIDDLAVFTQIRRWKDNF